MGYDREHAANWGNWTEEQDGLLTPKLIELGQEQRGISDPSIFEFNQYTRHRILFNFTLVGLIGYTSSPEHAMGIAHYCPGYPDKDKLWKDRFNQVISVAIATPQDSAWAPSGIIRLHDFYDVDFADVLEQVEAVHKVAYKGAYIPAAGKKRIRRHFDYCIEKLDELVSVLGTNSPHEEE